MNWFRRKPLQANRNHFPFRQMRDVEAEAIYSHCNEVMQSKSQYIMMPSSLLPEGGVIAVAEAFAIYYTRHGPGEELRSNLIEGLAWFSLCVPEVVMVAGEGGQDVVSGALDAYGDLGSGYQAIQAQVMNSWFERRIRAM